MGALAASRPRRQEKTPPQPPNGNKMAMENGINNKRVQEVETLGDSDDSDVTEIETEDFVGEEEIELIGTIMKVTAFIETFSELGEEVDKILAPSPHDPGPSKSPLPEAPEPSITESKFADMTPTQVEQDPSVPSPLSSPPSTNLSAPEPSPAKPRLCKIKYRPRRRPIVVESSSSSEASDDEVDPSDYEDADPCDSNDVEPIEVDDFEPIVMNDSEHVDMDISEPSDSGEHPAKRQKLEESPDQQ